MTYYVSLTGNDTNSGTESTTPWSTLQVSKLSAGDTVLFQGGSTFPGGYTLPVPVILGSYYGVATLAAGIAFNQCAGTVQNLKLVGKGQTGSFGILFSNSGPKMAYGGLVGNCLIQDFDTGIGFQGYLDGPVVQDCEIFSTLNSGVAGIANVGGPPQDFFYTLRNIKIRRCYIHDIAGNGSTTAGTGDGITLGNCKNVLIDNCQVMNCGSKGNSTVGIGMGQAADCVISNNIVIFQNAVAHYSDGDGIDLDVGCLRCVVEDNYIESSWGAGISIFGNGSDLAEITKDCIIRRNVLYNNGTSGDYPNILIDAPIDNILVSQNIFQIDVGQKANAVVGINSNFAPLSHGLSVLFSDNIFQCPAGMYLVQAGNFQGVKMVNNSYVSYDNNNNNLTFLLNWGATDHKSMAAWKAASGQESS